MNPTTILYIIKLAGQFVFGARNCISQLRVNSLDELQALADKTVAEDGTPNPFYYAAREYVEALSENTNAGQVFGVTKYLISVIRNDFADANEVDDGEYLMAITFADLPNSIVPHTRYFKSCED